jgi:hypothetical protein
LMRDHVWDASPRFKSPRSYTHIPAQRRRIWSEKNSAGGDALYCSRTDGISSKLNIPLTGRQQSLAKIYTFVSKNIVAEVPGPSKFEAMSATATFAEGLDVSMETVQPPVAPDSQVIIPRLGQTKIHEGDTA